MQSGYRMFSCAAVLVIVSVISRGMEVQTLGYGIMDNRG